MSNKKTLSILDKREREKTYLFGTMPLFRFYFRANAPTTAH